MPDKGLGELERLSDGERLLIDRRRHGETQAQAAGRHGLRPFLYGQCERDSAPAGTKISVPTDKSLLPLATHERCMLYRRRAGYTQARVARELKVCRWWLNQMERGVVPCDDLICYWEV